MKFFGTDRAILKHLGKKFIECLEVALIGIDPHYRQEFLTKYKDMLEQFKALVEEL